VIDLVSCLSHCVQTLSDMSVVDSCFSIALIGDVRNNQYPQALEEIF
jgi:hypothetical protein